MDSEVFRQIMPAEFHRRFLVKNRRADGRAFHSYRQPTVATKVLSNCSGSASVRCGNSYYLAGVRCEVGRATSMKGVQVPCRESDFLKTELSSTVSQTDSACPPTLGGLSVGQVSVSVEFPRVCGAEFRDSAGPCTQIPLLVSGIVADLLNSPAVIDKTQLVFSRSAAWSAGNTPAQRADNADGTDSTVQNAPEDAAGAVAGDHELSCSGTGDTFIETACSSGARHRSKSPPQYAWHLFVHVLCLEYDGNPLDCAVLAAVAALEDTCLPGIRWDENAKWWRLLPPSAEPRGQKTAGLTASDSSNTNSKAADSDAAETRKYVIPARKVRLLERPVAVTFSHLLSTYWVVDPTREEEALGCWLTICLINDTWEVTRFGGPPVKPEVLGSLKTVAAIIAKGLKRVVKVSDENT